MLERKEVEEQEEKEYQVGASAHMYTCRYMCTCMYAPSNYVLINNVYCILEKARSCTVVYCDILVPVPSLDMDLGLSLRYVLPSGRSWIHCTSTTNKR